MSDDGVETSLCRSRHRNQSVQPDLIGRTVYEKISGQAMTGVRIEGDCNNVLIAVDERGKEHRLIRSQFTLTPNR